jgi:hypothetical protein
MKSTYEKALYGFHPIAGVLAKPLFKALANNPTERKLGNAIVTRACNDHIVRSTREGYIGVEECSQVIRGPKHPMTRRNLLWRPAERMPTVRVRDMPQPASMSRPLAPNRMCLQIPARTVRFPIRCEHGKQLGLRMVT